MGKVQINLPYTLVAALLVFLAGQALVNRGGFLKRFSIPVTPPTGPSGRTPGASEVS